MLTSIIPDVLSGALAPEALTVNIVAGESGLDLTTVTAASMAVRAPDGEEFMWDAVIADSPAPTTTTLCVQHPFAAGDTDQLGEYKALVSLTVPGGGVIRAEPRAFRVIDKFGKRC